MKEIETPNLYLAAYLVTKHAKLVDTIPLDEGRVLFVFKGTELNQKYINRFYEGHSKVEPRMYSSVCKDLKAQAFYVIAKEKGITKEDKDG